MERRRFEGRELVRSRYRSTPRPALPTEVTERIGRRMLLTDKRLRATDIAIFSLWEAMLSAEPVALPRGHTGFRRIRKWRRGRRKLYRIEAEARQLIARG